jgi:hypothetical protein
MNHLQGADTYMFPAKFIKDIEMNLYLNYLRNIFAFCPDAYYQDDYVIVYTIYILGYKIDSPQLRVSYNINPAIREGQMHKDAQVITREKNTIAYFKKRIEANDLDVLSILRARNNIVLGIGVIPDLPLVCQTLI